MKNGYAIIECGEKRITNTKNIRIGDDIKLTFANGSVYAKVTKKEEVE